jgi:hypothetical protein
MVNFFLDSTIVADYLIIKLAIDEQKPTDEANYLKELETHQKIHESVNAYRALKLIKGKQFHEHTFCSSSFSISEVISVVYEKYCLDKLFEDRLPFKYWYKIKPQMILPMDKKLKIAKDIINFYMHFISGSPRKVCLKEFTIVQNTIDLITKKKLETHDAFLVSQAIFGCCDYFVTKDDKLRKSIDNSPFFGIADYNGKPKKHLIKSLSITDFYNKIKT